MDVEWSMICQILTSLRVYVTLSTTHGNAMNHVLKETLDYIEGKHKYRIIWNNHSRIVKREQIFHSSGVIHCFGDVFTHTISETQLLSTWYQERGFCSDDWRLDWIHQRNDEALLRFGEEDWSEKKGLLFFFLLNDWLTWRYWIQRMLFLSNIMPILALRSQSI